MDEDGEKMRKLNLLQSPQIRSGWTGQKIMKIVFFSLMPAAFAGIWFFGYPALIVLITAVISAWLADISMQFLMARKDHKKRVVPLNWSSLLTGLLLGLILPPLLPVWIPVVGSFFAIMIGKYAFGKGNNIFNPALIARVFLVFSFPALMGGWLIPDGVSSATPLTLHETVGVEGLAAAYGPDYHSSLFIGNVGGSIGETSALALLLGAAILIYVRIISLRIPLAYLGTVAMISAFFGRDVLFDLLAGGLMIGAFFMATDYVTSPITSRGKIIFGIGCGILTMLLRVYSANPEGVAFSILLMNAAVPLIERYTIPVGR